MTGRDAANTLHIETLKYSIRRGQTRSHAFGDNVDKHNLGVKIREFLTKIGTLQCDMY